MEEWLRDSSIVLPESSAACSGVPGDRVSP